MRVAVIGVGSIGRRHVANLVAAGHQPILFDIDPTNATDVRCVLLWDPPSLVACAVDAVMVCTPARTHATVAKDLLDAGYRGPLFVEKPLALSPAECDVFRNWPHPTTMVGYMLRWSSASSLRNAWRPNRRITCRLDCDMSTWPGWEYGEFILEASHEVDLALWLGGDPRVVEAHINDRSVSLAGPNWTVELRGDAARYRREWRVVDFEQTMRSITVLWPSECDVAYLKELEHFLACAATDSPTSTPFSDGIHVLDVIHQARARACTVPA